MSRNNINALAAACLLLSGGCGRTDSKRGLPPSEALASFELVDGFQIEQIAAEPLVADPVDMEIDEQGRMYVVEMHGYPLDKSGSGKVKLLSDEDGDGIMDKSKVFAGDLKFPTGVMRWKKGILVTDPPNLLYFEDADEDGKAEIRDTLLTGFALSNPQHNFNNPMLGIDNWIYLANESAITAKVFTEEFGDAGSPVHFAGKAGAPKLARNAEGRRVRLKPDEFQLEITSSASQFGQTYDQWGRHFLVSNANHIYHEVFQAPYAGRNPDMLISGTTVAVSDHGRAAEVFPITVDPEHQLLTDIGVFTSACGITAYNGGLFPAPYDRVVFVAEPVGNLVHADLVRENGATFTASRLLEEKEFLASRDPWFRPVNHYVGPDGALYVIDYYRRVIEHPEWMAEGAEQSKDLYDGIDQGRIYRITPKGTPPASWSQGLDLAGLTDAELVPLLGHAAAWYRRNAQRLLLDRKAQVAVPLLREMLGQDTSTHGRLHAAWTLQGLGALTAGDVKALLNDSEGGIRENAILLSESFLKTDPDLFKSLAALRDDPLIWVRFQLLCTLGALSTPGANALRKEMLFEDIRYPWMQLAALSAVDPGYEEQLNTAIRRFNAADPAYAALLRRLGSMLVARDGLPGVRSLLRRAMLNQRDEGAWQAALLKGIVQQMGNLKIAGAELEAERKLLTAAVFSQRPEPFRQACLELLTATGLPDGEAAGEATKRAETLIKDPGADPAERNLAVRFMALARPSASAELLTDLLAPNVPSAVQQAALDAFGAAGGTETARLLIKRWPTLTPALRDMAIGVFLTSEEKIAMLIDALESGKIELSVVSWGQQVRLMVQKNEELRRRSRALFAHQTDRSAKKKVLEVYQKALNDNGDPVKGEVVYKNNCAVCHQIGGAFGTAFGPDLASIRNRKPKAILADIIDPRLSIADGYDLWELILQNGELKQGIIGSETSGSVTFRVYGKEDETIARSQIASLKAMGVTMMPVGLENQISPEEMNSLLTFIKELN